MPVMRARPPCGRSGPALHHLPSQSHGCRDAAWSRYRSRDPAYQAAPGTEGSRSVHRKADIRHRFESGVLTEEVQHHGVGWAVTLLANDDLGLALVRAVFVVVLVAVDEHDDVRILLDGAGFAQVRHHGPFVCPLLERAVELRQSDYRYVEFLCERLQAARNFRHLRSPIFLRTCHLHKLQVVDYDQSKPMLLLAMDAP